MSRRGEQIGGLPVRATRGVAGDRESAPLHTLLPPSYATGTVNVVILALVAALLDLEQRRDRGKVRPPMDRDRSA